MKKAQIVLLFLLIGVSASAQMRKPNAGDILFQPDASIVRLLQDDQSDRYIGFNIRSFVAASRANRFSVDVAVDWQESLVVDKIRLAYARELHQGNSANRSFYWGPFFGIGSDFDFDDYSIKGGVFSGLDFFVSDNFFIGPEMGLGIYGFNNPIIIEHDDEILEAYLLIGLHMKIKMVLTF